MQYNITFRKKDKGWQYIISYKIGRKWKQKSKQGFSTKALAKTAADSKLETLKKEIKFASPTMLSYITFGELVDMYLEEKKYYLAASTIHNMEMSLKNFDYIKDYKVKDITGNDIQIGITNMIKKGNKPITVKSRVDYIKILFNFAISKEILFKNPVENVTLSKNRKVSTRRAIPEYEVKALLDKLKHSKGRRAPYFYLATLLAYTCGLRIGEILGLNYSDFDFENRTVKIDKQYDRFGNKISDPKSKNSNRVVYVPKHTLLEIDKFMKMNNASSEDMIFNIPTLKSFDKMINKKYKTLGFNICVHELRHTYATNLIQNGLDLKTTAYLLGHDIKMTMNIYTHVNKDSLIRAEKLINNYFNIDTEDE